MVFILFSCLLDSFRFDRDWKKIEAFVGSKTVIQVLLLSYLNFTIQVHRSMFVGFLGVFSEF